MQIEYCIVCDSPTGRAGAGEDSLYDENGHGPYCEHCFEKYAGKDAMIVRLRSALCAFQIESGTQILKLEAVSDYLSKWLDEHVSRVERLERAIAPILRHAQSHDLGAPLVFSVEESRENKEMIDDNKTF